MTGSYGQDWSSYTSALPETAGLSFFFVKTTEGLGYVNPKWQSQYNHGTAAGLVPGKYHYPHMHNSPSAEVDYFLAHSDVRPGDLLALDWEGYDQANAGVSDADKRAYKDAYLKDLKSKRPHNGVGMYANRQYWLGVDTDSYYQDFLWIATGGLPIGQPGIRAPWLFHQYGVKSVDLDYCHLDPAQLRAWVDGFAAAPAPQPPHPKPPAHPAEVKPWVWLAGPWRQYPATHSTLVVQRALHQETGLDYASGPGHFGPRTKAAYAEWQRRYSAAHHLGWGPAACDGIPGRTSLLALAAKYGFRVRATDGAWLN